MLPCFPLNVSSVYASYRDMKEEYSSDPSSNVIIVDGGSDIALNIVSGIGPLCSRNAAR